MNHPSRVVAQLLQVCLTVGTENDQLHEQVRRLQAALLRTGRHRASCSIFRPVTQCDCGAWHKRED